MQSSSPSKPVSPFAPALANSVCAFWFGERRYALFTNLVDSVIGVDKVAPVPLAPPAMLGVFSLRGASVALLDLAAVLQLPAVAPASSNLALVLRHNDRINAAVRIDRMDAVIGDVGQAVPTSTGRAEHPAVLGFFSTGSGDILTVLNPIYCMSRIEQLKFR